MNILLCYLVFFFFHHRLRAEIEAVCLLGRKENSEMKDTASHEIKDSVVVYEVRYREAERD